MRTIKPGERGGEKTKERTNERNFSSQSHSRFFKGETRHESYRVVERQPRGLKVPSLCPLLCQVRGWMNLN